MKQQSFGTEFYCLCGVAFLCLCNVTVFYGLHVYLESLGARGEEAGFIIGSYSLSAMFCYLFFSHALTAGRACRACLLGMILMGACGVGYLWARQSWALTLLRMGQGASLFLILGSVMALLVKFIPPSRAGQGFSLYSAAILLPYAVVPALADRLAPVLPSPAHLYALTAGLPLLGALLLLRVRASPALREAADAPPAARNGWRRSLAPLASRSMAIVLAVNSVYFLSFSALFYLVKDLSLERGAQNVGLFFVIQMGVMVAIRFLGSGLFNTSRKVELTAVALLLTGAGFLLLRAWPGPAALPWSAGLFGLGMGLIAPALNALAFELVPPQTRALAANMMMLSIQFGNFVGPFAGATAIARLGSPGFLGWSALVNAVTAAAFYATTPGAGNKKA